MLTKRTIAWLIAGVIVLGLVGLFVEAARPSSEQRGCKRYAKIIRGIEARQLSRVQVAEETRELAFNIFRFPPREDSRGYVSLYAYQLWMTVEDLSDDPSTYWQLERLRRRGHGEARRLAEACEQEIHEPVPDNTDIIMDFLAGPTPIPRPTPAPTATPLPPPLQADFEEMGFIFGAPQSPGWGHTPDRRTTIDLLGGNVRLILNITQGGDDEDTRDQWRDSLFILAGHFSPGNEAAVVQWVFDAWQRIWGSGPPPGNDDFPDVYSQYFDGVRIEVSISNGGFFLGYDYSLVATFQPRAQ